MYDETGALTWNVELDIYGRVRTFDGRSLNDCPFRYQGQYEDADSDFYVRGEGLTSCKGYDIK